MVFLKKIKIWFIVTQNMFGKKKISKRLEVQLGIIIIEEEESNVENKLFIKNYKFNTKNFIRLFYIITLNSG